MPGNNRKFILRSSPPKSVQKATPTASSPTLHHNAPIPIRGTGKPSSTSLSSKIEVAEAGSPLRAVTSSAAKLPVDVVPAAAPRSIRSRIPTPLPSRPRPDASIGLRFGLPASTAIATPKVATSVSAQALPGQGGSPTVHVPNVQPSFQRLTAVATQSSDEHVPTEGPVVTTSSAGKTLVDACNITACVKDSPSALNKIPPALNRTDTTASGASSSSVYTAQSAVETPPSHKGIPLEENARNGDEDISSRKDGAPVAREVEGFEMDAQSNHRNVVEDEDMVLSPGFDVIQALADTQKREDINCGSALESCLTTPKLRPHSRGISDIRHTKGGHTPLVITPEYSFPPSSSVRHGYSEHVNLILQKASLDATPTNLTTIPSPVTKSHPETPPLNSSELKKALMMPLTPDIAGHITAIIEELETLIGHPCVDRDAIIHAHREVAMHTEVQAGSVFGTPLSKTIRYASCNSILGGQTHRLPLVVFACVEELYRAGLRSPRLLRPQSHATTASQTAASGPAHNRHALHSFPALIAAFNTPPTYGDDIDLGLASLDDVSALLLTFLDSLPGGIVPAWLRSVLGEIVGIYERVVDVNVGSEGRRIRAIRAALLLLRLLPAAQFSLLVYLLTFLSQIPLYEAWNGLNRRRVAIAFARIIWGVGDVTESVGVSVSEDVRRKKKAKEIKERDGNVNDYGNHGIAKEKGKEADWIAEEEEAIEVLEWLLANWDDLSDGLFSGPPRGDGMGTITKEEKDGEKVTHRTTAMQRLDLSDDQRPEDAGDGRQLKSATPTTSVRTLLTRIESLERINTQWQWLQNQREAELRLMFEEGERRIAEAENAMMEERASRVRAEEALVRERAERLAVEANIQDAVLAERMRCVGEAQELKRAWERLARAWRGVGKESEEVGKVVGGIVEKLGSVQIVTDTGENLDGKIDKKS